jgi:outer membrane receptor for Fe3+-dicitrate
VQDKIAVGRLSLVPGFRVESIDFERTDYALNDPDSTTTTRVLKDQV